MPLTSAMAAALPAIASCTIATLGMPAHSSSTESRKLRALHEPQPPKPATATVTCEISFSQSIGSGGTETLGLRTNTALLVPPSAASSRETALQEAVALAEAVGHDPDDRAFERRRPGRGPVLGLGQRTAGGIETDQAHASPPGSGISGAAGSGTTGSVIAHARWGNRTQVSDMPGPPAATIGCLRACRCAPAVRLP